MAFFASMLYVAMQILRPQELRPEWSAYQVMDVLGIAALASTAVSVSLRGRPRVAWQQLALGVAFLLWSAFSVVAAIRWFGGAATLLVELSIPFCTLMLVALNVRTRRRLKICVFVVCASMLGLLAQSLSAYYSDLEISPLFIKSPARGGMDNFLALAGEESAESAEDAPDADDAESRPPIVKRAQGLGVLGDPNDFAQALVATIPLLFLAWRQRRPFANLLLVLLPTGLLLWGILLTGSRGGFLALLTVAPLARLVRLEPRARRIATTILAVAAVPGIVTLFGYALADESAMGRIGAWSEGLQMLRSSPIWGVGSGLFIDYYDRVAHNSFVQCFAETGLVGYFLWLGLIVLSLSEMSQLGMRSASSDWVRWARAVQVSLLAFLVGACFLSRTTSAMLFLLTGLTAAVATVARLEGEEVEAGAWARRALGVEIVSIVTVWLTSRAAW